MDIAHLPLEDLKTRLESQVAQGRLVLEPGTIDDARLAAFLRGLPGARLELADASFALSDTATWPQRLTVTGPVGMTWPVSAFGPDALEPGTVTLIVSRSAAGRPPVVDAGIAGVLHAGPLALPVTGQLTDDGGLRCALSGGGHPPQDLADLVALLTGAPSPFRLPAGGPFGTGLTIDGLSLLTRNGAAPLTTVVLELGAAVDWVVVPDRLVLRSVGVMLTRTHSSANGVSTEGFAARVHAALTIGRDYTVAVDVGLLRPWQLLVIPADGTLPSLADLAGFVGGADLRAAVDTGTQAVGLGEIGIDGVRVGFDPDAGALRNATITGHVTLAGVRVDVDVLLPGFRFAGSLADGASIRLKALFEHCFGASTGFPDIVITELALAAHPAEGAYEFEIAAADDDFAIGPVGFRDLSIAVAKDADGYSGSIRGGLEFAGAYLSIEARHPGDGDVWVFTGTTGRGQRLRVGDLVADLAARFGAFTLPAAVTGLVVDDLLVRFDTEQTFSFTAHLRCPVGDTTDLDLRLTVDVADTAVRCSATLTVGPMTCTVALDQRDSRSDTSIDAHWAAGPGDRPISLVELAEGLGLPVPELPPGLDLTLVAADLAYDSAAGQLMVAARSAAHGAAVFVALPMAGDDGGPAVPHYLAALRVRDAIGLSDLPLVGGALGGAETCAVEEIQAIVSSAPIGPRLAEAANALVREGSPRFPEQGTTSGLAFSTVLRFGAQRIPIALGAVPAAGTASPPGSTVGPSSGQGGVVAAAPTDADGTVWFTVQKAFGPVTIARVGARYRDAALWFVLDGSLEADGLSLALQGASIGVPVAGFVPRFDVRGLALSYVNAPLAILGGFTSVPPTDGAAFRYDGGAAVSMPSWGALAYGSYTEVDGEPSMFLFLRAAGGFGGPPAFSVTALAAGFGYNSTIRLPAVTEVAGFPLVAGLGEQDADGSPAQALAALTGGPQPWLSPAPGQTWLAVGVRFHTYRQFDTTALLAVEFGNTLTVLLLGVTTARFPSTGAARPYAQLQLELRSVLRPGEGIFALSAGLTRNSYLLDPACVLTGGFAFYAWFGEHRNAGDFAVTIGGYHPAFDAPKHYPVVPRVGFTWSLDAAVRISGTAYFALTPSAIMAGGTLDVRYHDGSLTAWFTAQADLLVAWAPFRFRTRIGVSVGIEYTANLLFTAKTLHLEAGAELKLWGPPTGGTVTVRLWIVTFTVAFGAAADTADPAETRLDWAGFQELLPAATASTTFTAAAGLAAPQTGSVGSADSVGATGSAGPESWPVRADGFAVTLRNAVPVSQVLLGATTQTAAVSGPPVDVRPLGRTGLTVRQRVTLRRTTGGTAGEIDLTATGWHAAGVTSDVPTALWGAGDGSTLDPGNAQLVPDRLTGLTLTAPPAVAGWTGGPVDAAGTLGVARITADDALPLTAAAEPVGAVATHSGAVGAIAAQIAGPAATAARAALFAALGVLGAAPSADGPVDAFAAAAGSLFTDEPMLTGTAP
ncbi:MULTISPECIES: DUF6603 domain-containing protein [unclassified Micromonospora]|uniref:DUF6603 domain-containing protein n=1 Tax=Micromonospora TaxID=1873 RepID=UPI00098CFAFF|nr:MULTISPECIES: DUF6603 domain-containing protein [unclassified Micromonospora]OON27122.1 hypothetical protein BSA16_33705 [Micromonospora sp. Rc5]